MKVLSDNGFEVLVDEEALPGKGERVKLAAQPLSKETVFDTKGA
jgi:DNA mismatch repair protein PMS2